MKLFYYSLLTCGLSFLVLEGAAKAQDASASAQSSSYGQLADLVSQIAILKAQMQVVQLQQQIEAAKRGTIGVSGTGGVPPLPNTSSAANSGAMGYGSPEIISISGREGRLSAVLLMPGGSEVNVVAGTPVGNGAFVRSVSPQAVQLIQDGKLIALPFVGSGTLAPGG